MRRNSFIVIISLTVIMQSCGLPYCEKIPFEDEDMLWLKPYEKGDAIIFESTLGTLDTILITDKEVFNPTNTFMFDLRGCNSWEGDNVFNAIAGFDLNFIDVDLIQKNPNVKDGLFSMEKIEKNKPIVVTLSFCELYSRQNTIYKDTCVVLSKKRIEDCLVLHRRDCNIGHNKPQLHVNSFVWSKRLGLVQYTTEAGEKFMYLKKIRASESVHQQPLKKST